MLTNSSYVSEYFRNNFLPSDLNLSYAPDLYTFLDGFHASESHFRLSVLTFFYQEFSFCEKHFTFVLTKSFAMM